MAALRLPLDGDQSHELLAAPGVPWFATTFGRDSLIVSLQNMIVYPDFARGTLRRYGVARADN
jgi:glycogen debranching enzyme